MVVVILSIALAAGVATYVALPLLRDLPGRLSPEPVEDPLQEMRLRLVADLDDLETSFHSGRVSHRDFDRLKAEIEGELGDVLRRIDEAEAEEDAEIERQLAGLRGATIGGERAL